MERSELCDAPLPKYVFHDGLPTWGSNYLWPIVESVISSHRFSIRRAFELGSGNGAASNKLSEMGFEVTAVDPSESGIAIATKAYPQCTFVCASGYDDLASKFGQFELVLSLEVLQHCVNPIKIAKTLFDLLEPGGVAIVSTTYHGYLKNLVLALTGRLDNHLNALWDTGPLKFFSIRTLQSLLLDAGFSEIEFRMAGRMHPLAKSMVAIARKNERNAI